MSDKKEPGSFDEWLTESLASLKCADACDREIGLTWFYHQIWDGRTTELLSHIEVLEAFFELVMSEDPAKESEGVNLCHALLDVGAEKRWR